MSRPSLRLASTTSQTIGALHAELLGILDGKGPVLIDGSAVIRIDTAALQMLFAFIRDLRAVGRSVTWRASSTHLTYAAQRLGLGERLDLTLPEPGNTTGPGAANDPLLAASVATFDRLKLELLLLNLGVPNANIVKGNSALFGFTTITSFVHVLETLLDQLCAGRKRVMAAVTDRVILAVDSIRALLMTARISEPLDTHEAAALTRRLHALILGKGAAQGEPAADPIAGLQKWDIVFRSTPSRLVAGILIYSRCSPVQRGVACGSVLPDEPSSVASALAARWGTLRPPTLPVSISRCTPPPECNLTQPKRSCCGTDPPPSR